MIRLLIVTGRSALLLGLRMRLAAESDMLVVGDTMDCEGALELTESLCPDVVLVDLESPHSEETGQGCALLALCMRAPVVVLSMYDDSGERAWADRANVAAFVAKFLPEDELLATIRQVAEAGLN